MSPAPRHPAGETALLQALAELFRHLGDPNRLRLLRLLAERERSVGELALALSMSLSAVSHQLRQLRLARLVAPRRSGQTVIYSLIDKHVRLLVKLGEEHVLERFS